MESSFTLSLADCSYEFGKINQKECRAYWGYSFNHPFVRANADGCFEERLGFGPSRHMLLNR